MSKILVLGAGGMLGHKVCQGLGGHDVVGTLRGPAAALDAFPEAFGGVRLRGGLDVLDDRALAAAFEEEAPEAVVNCVGLVKQHREADDAYLAVALNALLPHRLARLCARHRARLVHISTDCVFSGDRGAYREADATDARDLYGRSKALGETGPGAAAVTLRTSFIGRELKPPTHGLVEWFLAQRGGAVDGFARVIYSGLTSLELAGVVRLVVERGAGLSGVVHVASEPISKYDLLMLVGEIYGLDVEVRRAEAPVCDRSMVMGALTEATGYSCPGWSEMITAMRDDPTPYDAWARRGEP